MRAGLKTLLVVLAVVLAGALVVYRAPVWVDLQVTHLKLFLGHVQSDYVLTPEGRIHYYDGEAPVPGGGTPLVLVHGLGDRAESWEPMMVALRRQGFHVYALDLLGYGRSPKPTDSDYSISTQEKLVADFIQALGYQQVDVGGWSMGGWVALKLALDSPQMVNRVVVYDAAGIVYPRTFPESVFHPTTPSELLRLQRLLEPHSPPLPRFVARAALRKFAAEQWVIDRSIASMYSGKDLVDARLAGMQPPLLLVWGGDDALIPVAVGEQMHALDPRSELAILAGCGHLEPKTCTARAAAVTSEFLKANPPEQGGVQTLQRTH